MPWIHVEDVVSAIERALKDPEFGGPLNLSAPEPVRNEVFTRALAKAVGRPACLPVPGFALRVGWGGFGETLLASYRMVPGRLREAGFEFRHPDLAGALADLCG